MFHITCTCTCSMTLHKVSVVAYAQEQSVFISNNEPKQAFPRRSHVCLARSAYASVQSDQSLHRALCVKSRIQSVFMWTSMTSEADLSSRWAYMQSCRLLCLAQMMDSFMWNYNTVMTSVFGQTEYSSSSIFRHKYIVKRTDSNYATELWWPNV